MNRVYRNLLCFFCALCFFYSMIISTQAKSRMELVFIIDSSGSMDDDISGVRNNISNFVEKLTNQGFDYTLGLLSYETYVNNHGLNMTVSDFRRNLSYIDADGGTENGLDAIDYAMNNKTYYENSVVYFVLIGDEVITSNYSYYTSNIISQLKSRGIKVIAIGSSGDGYGQFNELANETGGAWYDITDNYATNLDKIFEEIQNVPIVNILSPSAGQWVSGLVGFIPTVEVTDIDSDTLTVSYYMDEETTPRDQQRVTNSKVKQTLQLAAIDFASLAEGRHKLKITVDDGEDTVTDYVEFNVDKTKPVIGSKTLIANNRSIQFQLTGSDTGAGLSSMPYKYDVDTRSSGWTNITSFIQEGLTPNSRYKAKFTLRDNGQNATTFEQFIYTKAEQPVMSIVQTRTDGVRLRTSDENPNNTLYQIKVGNQYINASGRKTSSPTWVTYNNKHFDVRGFTSGASHTIQIKAKNGDGIETSPQSLTFTTLSKAPTGITIVPSQRSVQISWNQAAGAQGYYIMRDNDASSEIYVGNATGYTQSGLSVKTSYSYKIAAKNAVGKGPYSSAVSVRTLPDPPIRPQVPTYTLGQTQISLQWPSVSETDYYELKMNGSTVRVNTNSYTHTGLTPEGNYTYQLRAVNRGGNSDWTQELQLKTLPYPPTTPVMSVEQKTNTSIKLSWPVVLKAEGYQLKVDGIIRELGSNTNYVHENLRPLSDHTYQIRAYNAGGQSPWSTVRTEKTHPDPPKMPINLMTTADKDKVTVTWYQVEFVEYYEVEVDGSTIVRVDKETYIQDGLPEGQEHTYRVRAVNVSGQSPWSTLVRGKTLSEQEQNFALTNLIAIVTNEMVTLSWDSVDQNVRYEIEVDEALTDLNDATVYTHTGLSQNEFHTYNIYVIDKEGNKNTCANLALSTLPNPPNAPEGLRGDAFINSIELRWDGIEGATAYDIEIDGDTVVTTNDIKYENTGLDSGSSHTYRLRAKNITGVTGWSPSFTLATLNPAYAVDITEGETFTFTIVGQNVQDFQGSYLKFTYDASQVEIEDLYEGTLIEDVVKDGVIDKTKLAIEGTAGNLKIRFNESIVPGTSWSGEIMTISFKAKTSGTTNINLVVEEE